MIFKWQRRCLCLSENILTKTTNKYHHQQHQWNQVEQVNSRSRFQFRHVPEHSWYKESHAHTTHLQLHALTPYREQEFFNQIKMKSNFFLVTRKSSMDAKDVLRTYTKIPHENTLASTERRQRAMPTMAVEQHAHEEMRRKKLFKYFFGSLRSYSFSICSFHRVQMNSETRSDANG